MSGQADSYLDLKNMPENFHPAAVWTRVIVMTIALWSLSALKPLGLFLFYAIGGAGVVLVIVYMLVCLGAFLCCVGVRLERRFPRPASTKSWASRTAIGWNIRHCRVEQDPIRNFFHWGEKLHSISMGLSFFGLFFIDKSSILGLFLIAPFLSVAIAFLLNDEMRVLADRTAKSDPRVAALIY